MKIQAKNEAEKVASSFLMAFGANDFAGARAYMHRDMTWSVMSRGVPGAGEHKGPDAIFEVITPIREKFGPNSPVITPRCVVSNDRTVVLEFHGGGNLLDGRAYDNNYVMIIEVEAGKIIALREYMDSFYVHNLFADCD